MRRHLPVFLTLFPIARAHPAEPPNMADSTDDVIIVAAPETTPENAGEQRLDVQKWARPNDGVGDVLQAASGIQIRRLGGLGSFTGVSLRGTPFRQTTIWLDGIPLNPDGVSAVDLSQWPLAGLKEIRVYRARLPASRGGSPIGGAVELLTTNKASPPRASIGAGSFGSSRASASATIAHAGRLPFRLNTSVSLLATQGAFGYFDDHGTRYTTRDDQWKTRVNNDRRQLATLLSAHLGRLSKGGQILSALTVRDEGLPGPIGRTQTGTRLQSIRHLGVLRAQGTTNNTHIAGQLWHQLRHTELSDPLGEIGLAYSTQYDDYHTVGGLLSFESALSSHISFRGSATARWEGFTRHDDTHRRIEQHSRFGVGAALDTPIRLWHDKLEIVPALDVRAIIPLHDAPKSTLATNPGVTLTLKPHRVLQVWLSGTRAFRPPDLTELYGNQGQMHGNPLLKPERATRLSLGTKLSGQTHHVALHANITTFARWSVDQISWLQNSQRTLVAVNFGQTRTLGLEVAAGLNWSDRLTLDVAFTGLQAIQTTDDPTRHGAPVPLVPKTRTFVRLTGSPVKPWTIGVDLDQTSATPVDPQGIIHQPARLLFGVFTTVKIPSTPIHLSLDIRNLLNLRTVRVDRDPIGLDDTLTRAPITDFVGYPLPGRTFWLSVGLQFPSRSSR